MAYVETTGGTFIHPFEDPVVISGQGTIGLEIAEQVDELEVVVVPIGGGGLASGISLALRAVRPDVRIVGVQAAGTRPGGSGFTIADGIAVKKPGELTMGILAETLDDIVFVEDEQIARGDGAPRRADEVRRRRGRRGEHRGNPRRPGRRLGAGARAPLRRQHRRLAHGAGDAARARAERPLPGRPHPQFPDHPGELAKLLDLLAAEHVNVVEVEHKRESLGLPVGYTGVELTLLTRDPTHCDQLVAKLGEWGYPVERLD